MDKIYGIILFGLLILGCKGETSNEKIAIEKKVEFNQDLADELKQMAEIDQIAAFIPQGEYKKLTKEQWNAFKDSIFRTNQKRVKEIFDHHGFIGYDLAGKTGSDNFWLIVQHSDHDSEFQKKVLEQMLMEVENNNANPKNYALLTDRVKLNSGLSQVYGTQVDYNWTVCQAFPKNLADSTNVNQRRKKIGLEPLEEYLNEMSKLHFEINKDVFLKMGIREPKLYELK